MTARDAFIRAFFPEEEWDHIKPHYNEDGDEYFMVLSSNADILEVWFNQVGDLVKRIINGKAAVV